MKYELYLVTNRINNKKYIGQTRSDRGFQHRWDEHVDESFSTRLKQGNIFHKAIRKYGKDAFDVKRLLKDIPESDIDRLESLWIRKLDTYFETGHGYNMTYGGQGVHGYKHTQETREKISNMFKGRKVSDEALRNRRLTAESTQWYKKRSLNPLWKQHLSEAATKRFQTSPGTFTGKKHTDHTKELISKKNGHKVIMLDKETGEELMVFDSAMKAAEHMIKLGRTQNKTANGRILDICNGNDKSAYGFCWKYFECND